MLIPKDTKPPSPITELSPDEELFKKLNEYSVVELDYGLLFHSKAGVNNTRASKIAGFEVYGEAILLRA